MKTNTEADVRTDTAIKVMAIFFVAIIFLALTTDPIKVGTKEGDRAPMLEGKAYNGSSWYEFDMDNSRQRTGRQGMRTASGWLLNSWTRIVRFVFAQPMTWDTMLSTS